MTHVIAGVFAAVATFALVVGVAASLGELRLPVNTNLWMAIGAGLYAAAAALLGSPFGTGACVVIAVVHLVSWSNDRGHLVPAAQPSGAGA